MEEIFKNPEQVPNWQTVAAGGTVDWNTVFAGYASQIDWPGAHVWRELFAAFPDAKVIHSQRPDASWWNSFSKTIGKILRVYPDMPLPPHVRDMMGVVMECVGNQTFGGKFEDKDATLAAYHLRAEEVHAAIPPEQLLVFDVAEGWEPLCAFLEVPIPQGPFPHRNVKSDFWDMVGGEPK